MVNAENILARNRNEFQDSAQNAPPLMVGHALAYARMGLRVLPLHEPIFGADGKCTGCTCEDYARSDRNRRRLEAKGLGHHYDPHYVCPQPGKHGRGDLVPHGVKDATTDEPTIRRMWGKYPTANIGLAGGDVLFLDADRYKDSYAGNLADFDEDTVTVLTGGGGTHLWYLTPNGAAYGNGTGDLPAGIDIRGHGGFVVAPPSLHPSGRRYVFEDGYAPHEKAIAPLPAQLRAQLDAAAEKTAKTKAAAVTFAAPVGEKPDLSRWPLGPQVLERILHPAPRGQRSEADASAATALAYAGLTDDEIRAVFSHYPIGNQGKYRERGDSYLARTIAAARAYVAKKPRPAPPELPDDPNVPLSAIVAAGHDWVKSAECAARLRAAGVKRLEGPRKTLDALLDLAAEAGSLRVLPGLRKLGEWAGQSHMTAARHLERLAAAGLVEVKQEGAGAVIRLTPILPYCYTSQREGTVLGVTVRSYARMFYADHRADDAFQPYRYSFAIARRTAPTVLLPAALSAGAALAWDQLIEHGELTASALAEETGMTVTSARLALQKLAANGYADRERENRFGAPVVYTLRPDAARLLDERRPEMASCGLGGLRAWRAARDSGKWATWRVREAGNERERQYWKGKAREEMQRADQWAAHLLELGIDPAAKVAPSRAPKAKEKGRAEAGTAAQWGAALEVARHRREAAALAEWTATMLPAEKRQARKTFGKAWRRAQENWGFFWPWLQENHGALFAGMGVADVVKAFQEWEKLPPTVPTIHFDGAQLAAAD